MIQEIEEKLQLIKSPDPLKREGAYSKLIELFSQSEILITPNYIQDILNRLCSERFLFCDIDEGETDSSVARSFSLLVIGLILSENLEVEINEESLVLNILNYIDLESDFRGEDERLGWVHCLAHLGDLLSFMSFHKSISKESIDKVSLKLIKKIISLKDYELVHSEDRRVGAGLYYALVEGSSESVSIIKSLNSAVLLENSDKKNIVNVIKCIQQEIISSSENIELLKKIEFILS